MKINRRQDIKNQYWIFIFSAVLVIILAKADNIELHIQSRFLKETLPYINANINSTVFILLVCGIYFIKKNNIEAHQFCMKTALVLSAIFLFLFLLHVFCSGINQYGDKNHDGKISELEQIAIQQTQYLYYFILSTHIILASVFLPFIILTAYKGLIGDYILHKKLGKFIYPIWFYISLTGPIIYWMLNP